MTNSDFIAECAALTIDPAIALESEEVQQALKDGDDDEVRRVLREEF